VYPLQIRNQLQKWSDKPHETQTREKVQVYAVWQRFCQKQVPETEHRNAASPKVINRLLAALKQFTDLHFEAPLQTGINAICVI
jgi:hypothetical protein